jgi:hypothetical protein
MKIEQQNKRVLFLEKDEEFVKKMAEDIGCTYVKSNSLTYNLCSFETIPSNARIFAWVHKAEEDDFWVATRKLWLDEAKQKSNGVHFPPQFEDGDCVSLKTKYDYPETIKILKLINFR